MVRGAFYAHYMGAPSILRQAMAPRCPLTANREAWEGGSSRSTSESLLTTVNWGLAQLRFCPLLSSRDSGVSPALPLSPSIYPLSLPLPHFVRREPATSQPPHPPRSSSQTSGQREPRHLLRPRTRGGEDPETRKFAPRNPLTRKQRREGVRWRERGRGPRTKPGAGRNCFTLALLLLGIKEL